MSSPEVWLPVVGYEECYEVSDGGNVRSIRNNHGNRRQRPLKPELTQDGYYRVTLSDIDSKERRHVSHLVLEAFVGPRPEGMVACHGDDDGTNNKLANLRWGTPRSNYDDKIRNGGGRGSKHGAAQIDEVTARAIKAEAANRSILARDIASKYGVSVNIVRNIRNGNSWGWL